MLRLWRILWIYDLQSMGNDGKHNDCSTCCRVRRMLVPRWYIEHLAALADLGNSKRPITKNKCTRAAKSGVFKWTISRRRRVTLDDYPALSFWSLKLNASRSLWFLLSVACLTNPTSAQQGETSGVADRLDRRDMIDKYVNDHKAIAGCPGVSVAAFENGELVFTRGCIRWIVN